MNTKVKVVISVVVILGAYASGRYMSPQKVVMVDDTTTDQDVDTDTHSETVVHVITKPDGTTDSTTTTTEDTVAHVDTHTEEDKTEKVTNIVPKVTLSFLAGSTLGVYMPVYGMAVTKAVLGPITVGIWGLTNKTLGVSVGVSF